MKALVLASGGVDSTTCLGLAVDQYGSENVIALAITYGQRHTKEIEATASRFQPMYLSVTVCFSLLLPALHFQKAAM